MQRSVEEVIEQVRTAPRENPDMVLEAADMQSFRFHFSRLLYQVRHPDAESGLTGHSLTITCAPKSIIFGQNILPL